MSWQSDQSAVVRSIVQMGRINENAFEHVQNWQIQIILRMRSLRHLPAIDIRYRI